MKKIYLLLLVFVLGGSNYASYRYGMRRGTVSGVIGGLIVGSGQGYWEGIFTCPCWDREGSFCSLCGIKLTKANAFEVINRD